MEGSLSLQGVWLSYPRGGRHTVGVLSDVSLDVQAGEVVAVLAGRAQGKTSLLRVVAGMERPDAGAVRFDGCDIWPRRSARRHGARHGGVELWRDRIALVNTTTPDVEVTVVESVALPLAAKHGTRAARLRADRALQEVGAGECGELGWNDIDNGERARVALAHAVAREPRLLLIDDLTATLGLAEASQIAELVGILAVAHGLTVLMCVGDARATVWCDRVATLANGDLLIVPASPLPDHRAGAEVVDFPGRR